MIRKLFILTGFSVLFACSKPIERPQNLLTQKKMSEMIADFALGDQLNFLNQSGNLEVQTRYILKQHEVTAKQFTDSYKYYLTAPRTLENIYEDAQEIILEKDPEGEKFINKKLDQNKKNATELSR